MAVAGFRTSGFRRVDRQMELLKCLAFGNLVSIEEFVNVRNNDGRTVLHMAVIGNALSKLVELLLTIPSIDLSIQDADGMTVPDLLSQCPRSTSSEILSRRLMSAQAISKSKDHMARSATISHIQMQGFERSPGTTFKISDAEIFFYTGIESTDDGDNGSGRPSSCSSTSRSQLAHLSTVHGSLDSTTKKKHSSVNYATKRLKYLLMWPHRKEKKMVLKELEDDDSMDSYKKWCDNEDTRTPLRQIFSRPMSLQTNKRTLVVRNSMPSPSTKKKFSAGLMHGFTQAVPPFSPSRSHSDSFMRPSISSPHSDRQKAALLEAESGTFSCSSSPVNSMSTDNATKKTDFV